MTDELTEPAKVDLETPDMVAANRATFEQQFPGVLADGVIDAKRLKELLDVEVVGAADDRERYGLMWAGKKEAVRSLQIPSRGTLIPDFDASVDWDTARNVFVEGDNLEVLKLLQKAYNDQVKLVYIDPPYNTGNDFVYDDDFSDGMRGYLEYTGQLDEQGDRVSSALETGGRRHSRWLTMMYPRLLLARNLLTQDGFIAISIDDNELTRLTLLCDEVFGEENFVASVVVQANKGGRDYLPLAQTHEYLVIYARNYASVAVYDLPKEGERMPFADSQGPYEARELRNRNPKFNRGNRPNLFYPFYINPEVVDENGYAAVSLTPDSGFSVETFPRNSQGADSCWRWGKPKSTENIVAGDPRASQLVAKKVRTGGWNIYEKNRRSTAKAKTIWDETEVRTEAGTRLIREMFGSTVFDHPKPLDLVKKLIAIGTAPGGDDLVLDYFAGSGTTHHAVCQLNDEDGGHRRVISVSLPEKTSEGSISREAGFDLVTDIAVARIRKAMSSIPHGASLGLRLLKLANGNFRDASSTPAGQLFDLRESTLDDGEHVMEHIAQEVLLKEGVRLDATWGRQEAGGAPVIVAEDVGVVMSLELTQEISDAALALGPKVVVFLEDGFAGADAVKANTFTNAKNAGIVMKTV